MVFAFGLRMKVVGNSIIGLKHIVLWWKVGLLFIMMVNVVIK